MILDKEQRIGAYIICGIAFVAWLVVALSRNDDSSALPPEPARQAKQYRSWEERKDSMKRADSIRYARWTEEREQRYDSFRRADALRREEWKRERQLRYDSFRIADSLWRDSVGINYVKKDKKDTVLDLNHTDTAELQLIRGIGAYKARMITEYGERLGGYYSPDQLTDEALAGLHLDSLIPSFTADSAVIQPIPVNTSGKEKLAAHPYLRYTQAKAIYELRRRKVRLCSIDDLRSITQLDSAQLERLRPYLSFE